MNVARCSAGGRLAARLGWLVLLALCCGCVWLQNEFFDYDRAPPPLPDAPAPCTEPPT
jgi:hypothetical protein